MSTWVVKPPRTLQTGDLGGTATTEQVTRAACEFVARSAPGR